MVPQEKYRMKQTMSKSKSKKGRKQEKMRISTLYASVRDDRECITSFRMKKSMGGQRVFLTSCRMCSACFNDGQPGRNAGSLVRGSFTAHSRNTQQVQRDIIISSKAGRPGSVARYPRACYRSIS